MNTLNPLKLAQKQFKIIALGVAAAGALGFATDARANALTNGSFEQGGNPASTGGTQTLGNGDTTNLPGWTVLTTTQISWDSNGAFGVPVAAGAGDYYLDITGNNDTSNGSFVDGSTTYYTTGGVYQTFNTIAGDTYDVSYLLGSDSYYNSNAALTPGIEAFISATAPASYSSLSLGSPTSAAQAPGVADTRGVWTDESFEFVATGSSTTLTLIGYSATNGDQYVGLDNVVVGDRGNLSSPPSSGAPDRASTALLLALGLAAMVSARKFRLAAVRA